MRAGQEPPWPLPPPRLCPRCRGSLPLGAVLCPRCGQRLVRVPGTGKSEWVVAGTACGVTALVTAIVTVAVIGIIIAVIWTALQNCAKM